MKALKIIGIIVGLILAIILVLGLIAPKDLRIEREITVAAPIDSVYQHVADFQKFVLWSPWSEYDRQAKLSFTGNMGQVGSRYMWEGNDSIGSGYMELKKVVANEHLELDLVFTAPWESETDVYYDFTHQDSTSTTLKWGYYEKYSFPINIMMMFMNIEEMLINDFDRGLNNLKEIVE